MFDEAHKLLTDANYREVFIAIKVLLQAVESPITFFTGSLPPSLEGPFREAAGLDCLEIIRMPTTRPEIQYAVIEHPQEKLLSEMANYIQSRVSAYEPDHRCMVFCRSVKDTQVVAERLGVPPYYAHITPEGRQENARIFDDWVTGKSNIMVSTTILGCGIDLASVRDVVHYDMPHSIIDKHQQDNRAGRDGQPSRAIIFLPRNRTAANYKKGDETFGANLLLPWAQDTATCRRILPAYFMDGIADPCVNMHGAQLCDNCERAAALPPPPAPRLLISNPYESAASRDGERQYEPNLARTQPETHRNPERQCVVTRFPTSLLTSLQRARFAPCALVQPTAIESYSRDPSTTNSTRPHLNTSSPTAPRLCDNPPKHGQPGRPRAV